MSQKIIKGRKLTNEEINYLYTIDPSLIDSNLLEDLFAYKAKSEPKFDPTDYFTLPKGKLKNSTDIQTTVGRYIFNKFILDTNFGNHVSYFNDPMNQKNVEKLEGIASQLLLEDKITPQDFSILIDKLVWIGFTISKFINASLTSNIIIPPKSVEDRKEELKNKYSKELANKDIPTVIKMEQELISLAQSEIKDMPDNQLYECGARGSVGNNLKNTSIMRGVVKSVANPDDVLISTSSLEEGIPPEELYAYADILTQASYSRAIGTRSGGYENKKLSASFQNVMIDEKDSDCGTKLYLEIYLDDKNYNLFKYRYILEGNRLVVLNDSTKSRFLNKTVKMRSPLYCKSDKLCNKCAGDLYYMLGINDVGLISNTIGSTILNKSLKAFHDMSIKLNTLDIENYISTN